MRSLPSSSGENILAVLAAIRPHVPRVTGRPVVFLDGDRTLCPEDTSRIFAARAGVDAQAIKRHFQQHGYVFDAFRFHAAQHLALGEAAFARLAPEVAAEVQLYPGVAEGLTRLARVAEVFVVSAGIPAIWRSVLDRMDLSGVGVIGGIAPEQPFVFGRAEKELVASLFREVAATLLAVGDSDVDAGMLLAADRAVVVVNHHKNADLMPHIAAHPRLWQIPQGGHQHAEIATTSFLDLFTLIEATPCR